jgi:hypothetical protein
MEDQASEFMSLGDRVAQLYPQALGFPFRVITSIYIYMYMIRFKWIYSEYISYGKSLELDLFDPYFNRMDNFITFHAWYFLIFKTVIIAYYRIFQAVWCCCGLCICGDIV